MTTWREDYEALLARVKGPGLIDSHATTSCMIFDLDAAHT